MSQKVTTVCDDCGAELKPGETAPPIIVQLTPRDGQVRGSIQVDLCTDCDGQLTVKELREVANETDTEKTARRKAARDKASTKLPVDAAAAQAEAEKKT